MKFSFFIITLLIYSFGYAQDSEINASKKAGINRIISLFKQKKIADIATLINYPLRRETLIPAIKNVNEFKQRFSEVFDQGLIDLIAYSKIEQWTEVRYQHKIGVVK